MFDDLFEHLQQDITEIYRMHDAFISDPTIFLSIPYPNFAKFSMIVLPHLYTVLNSYKSNDSSLSSILEKEVVMFQILRDVLLRTMNDDTITSILDEIISNLKKFEREDLREESYKVIGEYVTKMYCYLITIYKKIHASFSIVGDFNSNVFKNENKKEIEKLFEIIKNYESQFKVQFQQMTNCFQSEKLTDIKTKSDDIFLMEKESIEEFKNFLKEKTSDFPRCIICLERPATLFAVPCNCSIICDHCHIPKEDLSSTCIRCGKHVKEYIRVE